ncbi:hypothetical protein [Neoroseomonas soli]|uniref:Uncharacterized protein n=1 Tax=Neoroseomonas soli TaxID=1081025 RepID=A0A9X9WWW3_9PROT|nr:hypothetical protein [Neoroseomonas soli]MBR0671642.1 hypothetical protein [Neoroseomonas soli]
MSLKQAPQGGRLVMSPAGIAGVLARTVQDHDRALAGHGHNQPVRRRMFELGAPDALIGTPRMLASGQDDGRFGAALKGGRA